MIAVSKVCDTRMYVDIVADPCMSNPCEHSGACSSLTTGAVMCDCSLTGYGGVSCTEDVDECAEVTHQCQNNGVCQNTVGGYECDCSGTTYSGQWCHIGNNWYK